MSLDPRALLQKADKAAAGAGGGFSFFGGRQEKWENAADLYTQAANAFRLNKQNKEAGEAFEKCAAIQTQNLNEPDDAANSLTEAYKVYKLSDPVAAARCLEFAINRYTSKGNFRRAATHKQNLGEMYEKEIGDHQKAIESYELAASWFESDNAGALGNKSWLAAADLIALAAPENRSNIEDVRNEYRKAIEIFEKVAASSVSNNVMKFSTKDYLFKAGLCHLLVKDDVTTRRAFASYGKMDESFIQTNECQILAELFEMFEQAEDKTSRYESIEAMHGMIMNRDNWKSAMTKRIKESIVEELEFS